MPTHTPSDRCNYRDIAGRRCRLPRKLSHPDLCAHHARLNPEGCLEDPQTVAAEILGPSPHFRDAATLNQTLGKLLELHLARRIPARQAAIAGYLCQLLLQTLPHIERQEQPAPERIKYEFVSSIPRPDYSTAAWKQNTTSSLEKSSEGNQPATSHTEPATSDSGYRR